MKSISTIDPAITNITECLMIKVCTPVIDLKVGMLLLSHGVSLYFISSYFEHIG